MEKIGRVAKLCKLSLKQEEALKLVNQKGFSPTAAARQLGIDRKTIITAIRVGTVKLSDNSLYIKNNAFEYWNYIVSEYIKSKSMTLSDFKEKFKVHPELLKERISLFNGEIKDLRVPFKRDIFSKESEEVAYWLGFITADGGIYKNELRIKLSIIDKEHLIKFCHFIGGDPNTMIKEEIHNTTGKTLVKVVLSSKEIVSDLNKYGILSQKSGKEKPIANLDTSLIRHYMRGLFDGDGCIRNNFAHINFVGSYEIVDYFRNQLFTLENIPEPKIFTHGIIYRIYYYSKDNKKSVLNFLYNDSTIYLERKYNLMKKFCRL